MKRVTIAVHPKFFEKFDSYRKKNSILLGRKISQPEFSLMILSNNKRFPELTKISQNLYGRLNAKSPKKRRYI